MSLAFGVILEQPMSLNFDIAERPTEIQQVGLELLSLRESYAISRQCKQIIEAEADDWLSQQDPKDERFKNELNRKASRREWLAAVADYADVCMNLPEIKGEADRLELKLERLRSELEIKLEKMKQQRGLPL
jgi:hypothetical protein